MIEWFGPVLQDSYGATEVGTTCTISSEEWLQHPGSVGRAVPPVPCHRRRRRRQRGAAGNRGAAVLRGRDRARDRLPGRPGEDRRAPISAPACSRWARSATSTDDGFVYITDRVQRHDRVRRREHLSRRVRTGADRASRGRRRRRHRRAQPRDGRGGEGARGPGRSGRPAARRGADRLVPRASRRLQVPTLGRLRRRPSAAPRWGRSTSGSCAGRTGRPPTTDRR